MLKITLLGLGLLTGSLFAQDSHTLVSQTTLNGYSAKVFENGDIKLYDHGRLLQNENVHVVLYSPSHEKTIINSVDYSDYAYHTNKNLALNKDYRYVITFSDSIGGISHHLTGEL